MLNATPMKTYNTRQPPKSSRVLFDAADIDYLLSNLNLPQLRRELKTADVHRSVCRLYQDPAEYYWTDYAGAIKLAINIARTESPRSKRDSGWKPRSKKDGARLPRASDVKARYDIVDVISQYVDLHKAGRNFKGLCPFHHDRDPSLTVYPDSQRWWCFSCNVGGDVINFTMQYHNLDFKESIRHLTEGRS